MKATLRKLYLYLTLRGIKNFNKPSNVQEWFSFLTKLPAASTPEQQSLNKYFCRMYYFGYFYKIIVNVGAIAEILFSVIPGLIRKRSTQTEEGYDAILVEKSEVSYEDIIPLGLLERYPSMKIVKDERKHLRIGDEPRKLFLRIWKRNWFRPYYVLWVFREFAFFINLLERYVPKAVIVYVYERSIASPIITEYYELKGAKFITFMHGDYTLQLIHAFTRFSEFYVWDSHYVETLGNNLFCPLEQFRVYKPQKLQKVYSKDNEIIDLTYYLGSESDLTLERLGKLFCELQAAGLKCQVRRHPRRQNHKQVACHFDKDQIQDPTEVTIDESITQSKYIASLNSTVMSEAFYGGKTIILDDWTDPPKYESYVSRRGISVTMYHMLLSDFIDNTLGESEF